MSKERVPVIDVHHHGLSSTLLAAAERYAPQNGGSIPVPSWSIQQDREAMARLGITGILLSMPGSGTPEEVRALNTSLAEFSREDPQQYGLLANLPYGNTEAAVEEIDYVLDVLHGDGFALPSNYQGIYISDERLEAVLAELDRRKAVVFVHPNAPSGENLPLFGRNVSVYEFPFETTRAVMDLVYKGKMTRYPHIRWIIAHAGGTIPYLAYRLSIARDWHGIMQGPAEVGPAEVLSVLSSLYYELALSTSPAVFAALRELAGPEHVLLGTDYPMRPEKGVALSLEQLASYAGFRPEEQRQILSGTAQTLFPRFA